MNKHKKKGVFFIVFPLLPEVLICFGAIRSSHYISLGSPESREKGLLADHLFPEVSQGKGHGEREKERETREGWE